MTKWRFVLRLLVLSLIGAILTAHATAGVASEKVALVLGNGSYRNAPTLPNAPADGRAVAEVLKHLGFTVLAGIDLDRAATDDLVHKFAGELEDAKVGLFFYSGHGMQVAGENYLVPVDAKLERESDLEFETVPLQRIMTELERTDRTSIVILDACRDNPFLRRVASRSTATRGGLAPLQGGVGTLIAYATAPDTVAMDGSGEHSPFTSSLLAHIETPGLEIGQLLKKVRADVIAATDRAQVPWDHSSLVGDFYFVPSPAGATATPAGDEQRFWDAAQSLQGTERKIPALEAYLASYPSGGFAALARLQLDDLRAREASAARRTSDLSTASRTGEAQPSSVPPEPLTPEAAAERELQLDRARRRQVQSWLGDLGLEPRGADGNFGRNTRVAISAFQRRNGLPPTGYLDSPSLARLREAAAKIAAASIAPTVVAPAQAPARVDPSPSTQVLCRGADDPAWMEPRLIMLFQCKRLGGEWALP